ncbi:AraC family transcriptional regulator [Microbulbifer sp. OS29]|uniref:AraC family transcriptional regulator n=1 Tax=Microbulbifer okhotskensis TaxID=2926617 RepID=A0A9X2J9D3_9GAMM|nr:AraC family transcriptional regulator [Microbulbifer okhotskensis]MCO1336526.1 AraC family transcriptional regulator [Microbulbifer okhotskensis]
MAKYDNQFTLVLEYIEANLDSDIDIDKLCQISNLSKYHFHRQCSLFFGMPIMAFTRLLRLKRSAYQLAYRHDLKVLEVALATGYESHEAFSRAFKKALGYSPSEFRKTPSWEHWQAKYQPIMELRNNEMLRQSRFDVNIIEFPETTIATLEHRAAPGLLSASLKNFITWRKKNKLSPKVSRTFNLIYNDPSQVPSNQYRIDLCCSVDASVKLPDGDLLKKTIAAGECASIRHIGSDDSIGNAINHLYQDWLAESAFNLRDFPLFLERVKFFPDTSENEAITDIYLPIEQPLPLE